MFTKLPIISNSLCKQWYKDKNQPSQYVGPTPCSSSLNVLLATLQIDDSLMCTGLKEGGRDACKRDSGGPLSQTSQAGQTSLLGVVSWGQGCAEPLYPGVYTRVTAFIPWIRDQIQAGRQCSG